MPRVESLKPAGNKFSYSTFFITISTNQRNYDREKLIAALTQIFGEDDMFYTLLRGDTSKIDKEWSTVQFSAEKGHKKGFMHSHVLVKLRHNTKVQFKYDILRRVLEKELGLEGVHIDCKGYGNSDKTLEQYIENQ
jgi:hypothetical protein